MADISEEEIFQVLGKIANNYELFECAECAKAMLNWLEENGIERKLLRLKTKYRERYIVSLRLEALGISESITKNGIHYGVEVCGKVFDNLSGKGLIRSEWIGDFCCRNGEFLVEELEHF